jgi:large subunit ribosomal protein L15
MTLSPQTIQPARGAKKTSRRLGRGHGTGRGKSAGRGTKGQRARTGGKSRSAIRAFKKSLQKIPKLRGVSSLQTKPAVVSLAALDRVTKENDVVTPRFLEEKGVVARAKRGVKILGSGAITKKITVQGCAASKVALAAIEAAGGTVVF